METFFLACFGLGGGVLLVQLLLGLIGIDHDVPDVSAEADVGVSGLGDGLDLLSVRALAAGVAFFGVGGLAARSLGLPAPLAAVAALVPGGAATVATAFLTRQLLRLESDGSIRIENAVGVEGSVYLTIPEANAGAGRIQLPLQGRTVELRAVTRERAPIPTGTPVVVVALVDGETVEVLPTSTVGGILDDND